MDENNNKNLILAIALSLGVLLVWTLLFPQPDAPAVIEAPVATAPEAPAVTAPVEGSVAQALATAPRLAIDSPEFEGSVSMLGGRIDDLSLRNYRETLEDGAPIVRLLEPVGEDAPFYALFGWSPAGSLAADDVPGPRTEWSLASGDGRLSPDHPVTLQWDNGKGQIFAREISVDDKFMFTVTDKVTNNGAGDVSMAHYSQIARHGEPQDLKNFFILHEGPISRADGTLSEMSYEELTELPLVAREGFPAQVTDVTTDGWIGFTDHYWMAILVPEQGKPYTQVSKYVPSAQIYQTEVRQPLNIIAAGQTHETSTRFFAGAKEWASIVEYQNQPGFFASLFTGGAKPDLEPIPGFLDSIDWGWFFFLTKPIFAMLHWLNAMIGNMGLAIIALTVILKIIVLPLAYKSYVSMARMKELQPEMEALKERAGDDRQKLQKEMMQLYREKKVNPAAGCLPILIQIPIFFSLYKVIFVTIELRHAPFFGWLSDLSAPDPSSLFNFFGLLPWAVPETGSLLHMIFIGVLPILLGVTMWLQQKLNPAPTDASQAMIFAWMPWIFMFMLGGFASGLVVYWIANNIITFTQQYIIMRSHGHKPDIFGNIRAGFSRKKAVAVANSKTPAPKADKKK